MLLHTPPELSHNMLVPVLVFGLLQVLDGESPPALAFGLLRVVVSELVLALVFGLL